jgi:hypothetical protein
MPRGLPSSSPWCEQHHPWAVPASRPGSGRTSRSASPCSARFRARCLRSNRVEGAQAVLGELTLGVGRDLDDQHVAGGPVHDLRWDGAELVIPNGT